MGPERDFVLIQLILVSICGAVAAVIASNKGRSGIGWFFGGFFLGIIGIVIVAVLPNLKEQKAKETAIERENRRLREQLMQEQIKGEAFRQHTAERLDIHDVQLGVDTRSTSPALSGPADALALGFEPALPLDESLGADRRAPSASPTAPPPQRQLPPEGTRSGERPPSSSRLWYYHVNGQQYGPIGEDGLVRLIQSKQVTAQTMVWTEQLKDWKMAGQIANLRRWMPS